MDEQHVDFDDLDGDPEENIEDADTEIFYWALKGALERTPLEPPPAAY